MVITKYQNNVSNIIIRKQKAIDDYKLKQNNNNGRKVLAIAIHEKTEQHIQNPEWEPALDEKAKTPILETGYGGLEVATFNQKAKQDSHKHLIGTEIYIVLEGLMKIKVNNNEIHQLKQGDEIIILPGTIHEVLREGKFLTRVHLINCHGDKDKYINFNGQWVLQTTLQKTLYTTNIKHYNVKTNL